MNKAQKKFIHDYWLSSAPLFSKEKILEFSEKLLAVDPTPDPETYCIWLKDEWLDKSISGGWIDKEKATKKLGTLMESTFYNSVEEYKKGDYLLTASGARYEVRKEE